MRSAKGAKDFATCGPGLLSGDGRIFSREVPRTRGSGRRHHVRGIRAGNLERDNPARVARAAGVDPSTVHNLIISNRVPQLNSLEHLDALVEFLDRFRLAVLIIDPAFLAMDGADAGNLFIQGQLLRRISELCQEQGVTLILCHHTKKAAGVAYEPLELASISWSGFAEFARQWLLINRREPYIPGTGSHRLWLTVGGSVGHGGLWGLNVEEGVYTVEGGRYWQVEVLDPSEVKEATQDRREAERQARTEEAIEKDCERSLARRGKVSRRRNPEANPRSHRHQFRAVQRGCCPAVGALRVGSLRVGESQPKEAL